jgi:GcrA cell cycle regulator
MTDYLWDDERVERLKQLFAENYTASGIVQMLGGGLTRSAVCGKLHRLGLSRNGSPPRSRPAPSPRLVPRGDRIVKVRKPTVSREVVAAADQDLPPTDDPFSAKGCRWPVGEVGSQEFRFCQRQRFTAPNGRESSWCEAHHVRGHQRAA